MGVCQCVQCFEVDNDHCSVNTADVDCKQKTKDKTETRHGLVTFDVVYV